ELDQLRHLQGGQALDVQPAAAAVEGLAEQDRHQQHQADQVACPHELADEPQVKIRKQEHHPYPDQGVEGLGLDVVIAVPHPEIARGIAGAEQHHQRSEEHTSELQSRFDLVCRLLLEKK